jgi:tetratricopeptide (TPR) repeat protein
MKRDFDKLVADFLRDGFVVVEAAFAPEKAQAAARRAAALWTKQKEGERVLPSSRSYPIAELAPDVWELVCRLVGGRDALADPAQAAWSDGFVVGPPGPLPVSQLNEWHVDGDARSERRLDSADPGLLVYSYWSDVAPGEGGTLFLPGSVAVVARFLAERGGGARKREIPFENLARRCGKPYEFTGPAGTAIIAHPLMLHRASPNAGRSLRLLSVRTLRLAAPPRPQGASPVERVTGAALGLAPALNAGRGVAKVTGVKSADFSAVERLAREGRHEEAVALLDQALAADPSDAEALNRRAEAQRCRGRHDLALRDLERLTALDGSPGRLCARGEGKRHLLDLDGAAADAQAALKLDPKHAGALTLLAEARRSQGRFEEAVEAATAAVAASPSWAWAHVVRAKARRYAGDLKGALEDTLAAEKAEPQDPAYALGWRGEILRKQGKPKPALAALEKAVKARPHIAWMRALRGECKRALGKAQEGFADVLEAARLDGNLSHAYDFLGGEPASIASDPAHAWTYAWRGAWKRGRGDAEGARRDLDTAVALDGKLGWALAWRGELRLRSGDAAGAQNDLAAAAKALPKYAEGRLWLGQAKLEAGDPKAALKEFDAAAKADAKHALAQVGRAVALEALGKGKDAAKALEKAYALDPRLKQGGA